MNAASTVDPAEVAKFEAMAAEWWNPNGKFKPLHMLNPCRLDYITSQIASEFDRDLTTSLPFKGLRILDIGCGGGLLSEPMARLGADVVGADPATRNIPVAQMHAEQSGLTIDYRLTTAEDLALAGERDRRTNSLITELANIVFAVTNRQDDHENRISRLEQP